MIQTVCQWTLGSGGVEKNLPREGGLLLSFLISALPVAAGSRFPTTVNVRGHPDVTGWYECYNVWLILICSQLSIQKSINSALTWTVETHIYLEQHYEQVGGEKKVRCTEKNIKARFHHSARCRHKSVQVMRDMQRLCNESVTEAVDFQFLSTGNETFEELFSRTWLELEGFSEFCTY